MNNVMLDELPSEWNGYRIETDYRIGLQISQLLYDEAYSEYERLTGCVELLFLDMPDSMETAMEGLSWFFNGWNHDHFEENSHDRCVDFDIDQWRIYSAFRNQYQTDLAESQMHWWQFMGMLTSLQECAYTQVVSIREEKIDPNMPAKEKEAKKRVKRIYAIRSGEEQEPMTEEEKTRYDEFMKYAKIKKAKPEPG